MDRAMITKLGIISGEILTLFGEVKGPLCVREIEAYLGESKDIVLMCLGWLIREGMVNSTTMNEEPFYYPIRMDKDMLKNKE